MHLHKSDIIQNKLEEEEELIRVDVVVNNLILLDLLVNDREMDWRKRIYELNPIYWEYGMCLTKSGLTRNHYIILVLINKTLWQSAMFL